ncbi:hypothetical protein DL98DRAFT_104933 [Cadophora sp. DSE1049]|nr:hypothetical protein DL98DRAFT_104933 [Cadophora sp. DSE1049]
MGTAQLPDPGSVNVPAATLSIGPTEPPTPEMDREILVKSEAACAACGEVFTHRLHAVVEYRISVHAKNTGHLIWACSIIGCQKTFSTHRERDAHQDRPHVVGHGHFDTPTTYDCVECGHSSSSKADLLRHAKELQHRPYACECGSSFSRLDVLNRHLEKFDPEDPKHPCKYCRRHRGPNGFRRLDHLMQHIRNYHHHEMDNEPRKGTDTSRLVNNFPTCPHSDCPGFRDDTFKQQSRKIQHAGKPFATQSAFTKHTRDTHNECIFPCDVAGCERVGRLGYFREKDLLKHRRAQHPDASPYVVEKRATRWTCTRPGCSAILAFSSMAGHLRYHDWFASLSEASAAQVAGSPSWKRIGNDGSIDRS